MKVCLVEACDPKDRGSIGAFYIEHHAKMAGYPVDRLNDTKDGYDVELISIHHCGDFLRLKAIKKRAKWRLVGGHPMQNNPRPVIPFADAICIGEGETWIKEALTLLDKTDDIETLVELSGTIVCKSWIKGGKLPAANIEQTLPDNPPYLNYPGTKSAAWYIEIARGCPYHCHYCGLGNSVPYRKYDKEHIMKAIGQANTSITKKINLFAPDEAAHPDYQEIYQYIKNTGHSAGFASMRIDSVLKSALEVNKNHLIRVGLDGLTEKTRYKVCKNISDQMVYDYFDMLIKKGHSNFKIFMIIGYPWETAEDFCEWENLMESIFSIPLDKNVSLRIKWTPFIPQPCTPLANAKSNYTMDFRMKILRWHEIHRRPKSAPGWYIENDGLMSIESHRKQCLLTSGDEDIIAK